jgi:hypothetical protein
MTELEFYTLYREKLSDLSIIQQNKLLNSHNKNHSHFIQRSSFLHSEFYNKANLLVSEILIQNDINPETEIIDNLSFVPIVSTLLRKVMFINCEIFSAYNVFAETQMKLNYNSSKESAD